MGKRITLLSLLVSTLTATAQPTLTHQGIAPQVGLSVVGHAGAYQNPGSAGANQTWDFSTFNGPNNSPFSMLDPETTPHATMYPAANVSQYLSTDAAYEYLENENGKTATYLLGAESPTFSLRLTTDKQTIFIYPLSYNDSWHDTYQGTGLITSFPFARTGTVSATADGWGTLITPFGTYTDVLRLHITMNFTDILGTNSYVGSQEVYQWYKEGLHFPIFLTTNSIYNGSPGPSVAYYTDAPIGFDEQTRTLPVSVYPVPAKDELFISLGANYTSAKYEVTDITGRKILSGELSQQLGAVSLQGVTPGHYLLKVFSGDAVLTRKVMIQ